MNDLITDDEINLLKISNSLTTYRAKYLHRHLINNTLQSADMDDLNQELALLMLDLQKNVNCLSADNIPNYCYKCYRNRVIKFLKQKKKRTTIMKYSYRDEQELYEFLSGKLAHAQLDEDIWNWNILQVLSEYDRRILILKAHGNSYELIKKLIGHQGSLDGLRKLYENSRKKVIAEYELLSQRQRF